MWLFIYGTGAFIAAALVAAVLWWVLGPGCAKTLGTCLGAIGAGFFFLQKQKLDDLGVFRSLFDSFNRRFEKLCDRLKSIKPDGPLDPADVRLLNKYLDLCSEEYYFHKHGNIYPDVWRTWCRGALSFCKNERVLDHFEEMLQKSEDYYGLTMAEIRSSGNNDKDAADWAIRDAPPNGA